MFGKSKPIGGEFMTDILIIRYSVNIMKFGIT